MTAATARWRWRLVRRKRFRRALAALRDGRAEDAQRELVHAGAAGDEYADLLSAIAVVMASPSLPDADRCVEALERVGRSPGPEALAVAAAVLQPVLRLGPGDRPEFVAYVAQLTERLMHVTGPLPWGLYNVAVNALRTGDFVAGAGHLASGVMAPDGGWPPPLLGGACAAVLGEPAALSRWLAEAVVEPDFADDLRLLTGVRDIFECLRDDRPVEPTRFDEVFGGPSGPLTRAVPQLSALKTVLADAVRGVPTGTEPTDLDGCVWGQWLCDRLRYASGEATDVLSACAQAGGQEPALIWQRLGSQQDLLPLLPERTAETLSRHLIDFGDSAGWTPLVEARVRLAGEPTRNAPEPELGSCPWWPADGALQKVARQDGEVERWYLEGRQALRCGRLAEAGRRFEEGQARITGEGMATRLVALRWRPILGYWEGVALAHLGLADEASALLRTCANGVKAREAAAQLGLLAIATGDLAGATGILATIPEPRPASADYLAAVLTARDGDKAETASLLQRIETRAPVAGVYVAAGRRLRGRVHEAAGEIAEAVRWYRRAVTHRPEDAVATARLARVWLRRRYDDADVPAEPLLDRRWSASAGVESAAPLLLIRDCLDGPDASSARELLSRVPADPGLRLLVLRSAVAAGDETGAVEAVQKWAAEDDPDPRLTRVAYAARAGRLIRELCLAGGEGPVRRELAELEWRLRAEAADPVMAFWAECARLMSSPEEVATASPLPAMDDESRSASLRLFAGLMSVFSKDPEQRRIGARRCREALAAGSVRDELAEATVRCLAADALGDDREFLAAYGEIETEERALPFGPAEGYLAVTEARLRVGDLDAVIDGFIPDALADLSHPGVRRAMGVAYARRAVRVADRDPRAALRDIDQARELLREIP
jgi:hypothetical protein